MVPRTLCVVLLIALAGCSKEYSPAVTVIPAPAPPPFRGLIREITDTYQGRPRVYEVTPPADGTLVVRLSWEPTAAGVFALKVQDREFVAGSRESVMAVERIAASAGQRYRVEVEFWADDYWDYYGTDVFFLKFSLE